jgi:serine/threonine protein kinase
MSKLGGRKCFPTLFSFLFNKVKKFKILHSSCGGIIHLVENNSEIKFIVKEIDASLNNDEEIFKHFTSCWKEAMKISQNIVEYIDHWYYKGHLFLAMEFCEDGDLAQKIAAYDKENKKFTVGVFFFFLIV